MYKCIITTICYFAELHETEVLYGSAYLMQQQFSKTSNRNYFISTIIVKYICFILTICE